jgi:hypothetical protein
MAINGVCLVEPAPNLNQETRWAMDGMLSADDKAEIVKNVVIPRVKIDNDSHIYGDKNLTYGPFVQELYQQLGCKFIFSYRDGRDVITSLKNWHDYMFGSIYRECHDPGMLAPVAISRSSTLLVHHDTSDYSRPRPLPGEFLYDEWELLSREEMCAYYWSKINQIYLDVLAKLPQESYRSLNYSNVTTDDIYKLASFLGLEFADREIIKKMLYSKINSVQDRTGNAIPDNNWKNWDSSARKKFSRIAGTMMKSLNFYSNERICWKPPSFDLFFQDKGGDHAWYEWMYNYRKPQHDRFIEWVTAYCDIKNSILELADFGCGIGYGYTEVFAKHKYCGVDISRKNNKWCLENNTNLLHSFICEDYIANDLNRKFDVVFSSGTIDNSYDVDQYLAAMVRHSKKWIYLTCYRGWFPELKEHKYSWSEEHGCFYNNISPSLVRKTLEQLGCTDISIQPIETGNMEIPYETEIFARIY